MLHSRQAFGKTQFHRFGYPRNPSRATSAVVDSCPKGTCPFSKTSLKRGALILSQKSTLPTATAYYLLQFQSYIVPFIPTNIKDRAIFKDEVLSLDPFQGA